MLVADLLVHPFTQLLMDYDTKRQHEASIARSIRMSKITSKANPM